MWLAGALWPRSGVRFTAFSRPLPNVTNNGGLILSDGGQTTLSGTLTNNGTITFASIGDPTSLFLDGNVTLAGSGTLTLDNTGLDIVEAVNFGDTFTIGANQTIQGSGNLGDGQTNIVNNGTITADQPTPLQIGGGSGIAFTNNGTVNAINGGALQFNGTTTSSGTVDVGSGTLTATGSYTQTAGTFRLAGGTVTSSIALNLKAAWSTPGAP